MSHVYKHDLFRDHNCRGRHYPTLDDYEILLAKYIFAIYCPHQRILRLRYAYNRSWRLASIMHESMGRKSPPLLRERRPSQHLDTPIPFNDRLTKLARIAQKAIAL